MEHLEAIVKSLADAFGDDKVMEVCRNYLNKNPVQENVKRGRGRPRKETPEGKKERKPREQTEWNKMVKAVYLEMREKDPKFTPKMAFEEAGRRKRASDPEAQAKYEAKMALKKTKMPLLPPSSKTSCADGLSQYESDIGEEQEL